MSLPNGDRPATPIKGNENDWQRGLTKREAIAALLAAGMIAGGIEMTVAAYQAPHTADDLLAALDKR